MNEAYLVVLTDKELETYRAITVPNRTMLAQLLLKLCEAKYQVRFEVTEINNIPVYESYQEFFAGLEDNDDLTFGVS